jgi:hypothetical protein
MTHGQLVVEAGVDALKHFDREGHYNLVEYVSKRVSKRLKEVGINGPKRPGFVFVAFLPGENAILRVGDCQYFIDGVGENSGLMVDRVKAEIRQGMLRRLLAGGQTVKQLCAADPTATLMGELKDWQHDYRNHVDPLFGYGVVDGTHVPTEKVEFFRVPDDARKIVLTSDGYPPQVVRNSFDETERELAALLKRDPLCMKEWVAVRGTRPGHGRPDDCSYILIERE